jgi:glutamate carboxypeptidase
MLPGPYTAGTMDARVLREIVERRYEEFVGALRDMVSVDSGTHLRDGVNRVADQCEARLRSGGWDVERQPHEPSRGEPRLGDLLIGRMEGSGGARILLIGHMDTVFLEGTAAERPFTVEDGRARGPGVSDMKAGLLAGFVAVEALREAGFDGFGRLTFVCNPDEEIGSPFSGPVIRQLARETDVALVLEAARENGDLVSARKGIIDFRIEISGRAAHAGVEPERGRNAIEEAAYKTLALHKLNGKWPGVSVNVGVIAGGTRPNVVPERCVLEVDARAPKEASFHELEAEVQWLARAVTLPDTVVSVQALASHPPMEKTDRTESLLATSQEVARELGFEVGDAATGGASDANTTAAAGVPTLDGLGPVGGDAHGPAEWLDLSTVVPRVSLLAGLLSRLGPGVPKP